MWRKSVLLAVTNANQSNSHRAHGTTTGEERRQHNADYAHEKAPSRGAIARSATNLELTPATQPHIPVRGRITVRRVAHQLRSRQCEHPKSGVDNDKSLSTRAEEFPRPRGVSRAASAAQPILISYETDRHRLGNASSPGCDRMRFENNTVGAKFRFGPAGQHQPAVTCRGVARLRQARKPGAAAGLQRSAIGHPRPPAAGRLPAR